MKRILSKIIRKNYDEYEVFEYLDFVITKTRPLFVHEKRKQKVERKHFLLSNYEYVVQNDGGYTGDSYYGSIARKIRFTNLWILIDYDC